MWLDINQVLFALGIHRKGKFLQVILLQKC